MLSLWFAAAVLLAGQRTSPSNGLAKPQVPSAPAASSPGKKPAAATIRAISAISDTQGSAIEIISNGSLVPTITKLDGPPRLVIDLEGALASVPQHQIPVELEDIKSMRINQYLQTPPLTRVVVYLTELRDYYWEMAEDKLVVHLRPPDEVADEPPAAEAPVASSGLTKSESGTILSTNSGTNGALVLSGNRLALGSSVTAGADTAVLNLSRGGQIRVCPGTTVSVTTSPNGGDLMLGMSTGALETHYRLASTADSILTPDFRILLAGPGEFHYAVSADSKGNTCVRALSGTTASAVISELMTNDTYQMKSNEQVVFRSGELKKADAPSPIDCGCPPPRPPVLRAEASPPASQEAAGTGSLATAKNEPPKENQAVPPNSSRLPSSLGMPATADVGPEETASLPSPRVKDGRLEVEAPLVFRAVAPPISKEEANRLPITTISRPAPSLGVALPPASSQRANRAPVRGFFGKVKRFLGTLFR